MTTLTNKRPYRVIAYYAVNFGDVATRVLGTFATEAAAWSAVDRLHATRPDLILAVRARHGAELQMSHERGYNGARRLAGVAS